jgi:hypothetical protein
MKLGAWLVLGAVYGLLLFGIANAVILPRTNSLLALAPVWALGAAHVLYGAVLGWLVGRGKSVE